jgi:hypothetical protein
MQISLVKTNLWVLHMCADALLDLQPAHKRQVNHSAIGGLIQNKYMQCLSWLAFDDVTLAEIGVPAIFFAELPPLPDLGAASEQAAKTVTGLTDGVSSAAAGALLTAAAAATVPAAYSGQLF